MFTDAQYDVACKELVGSESQEHRPVDEGWEFFVESHDVTIYRKYTEASGLYEYKIYGFMRDVSPDVCAKVYMDIEYRKKWDTYVKELTVKQIGEKEVIYWNINFPFFMSNRDYVYSRELREIEYKGKTIWVVLANSVAVPDFPEQSGVVRVCDYFQSAALMSDGKGGTQAFMHYYDNPGGMIPTFLINWGAKTGVPQFLTIMQQACLGYEDYLKNQTSS